MYTPNTMHITFLNNFGLIYNADDFYELRTKYRIIGEFLGTTKTSQIALPLVITAEQTYILIKKSIAKVIRYPRLLDEPSNDDKLNYQAHIFQCYEEQKILLREERKNQIETYVDDIIKRKGVDKTREDIIKEELDKLPSLEIDNIINPVYTEHPDFLKGPPDELSIEDVIQHTSKLKRLVFEDLWEKKYYVTSGRKFGGDFLVYLGDPVMFHAVMIVKCFDENQLFNVSELVTLGRLGHSVKKQFVLASVDLNDEVHYVTTDWLDG